MRQRNVTLLLREDRADADMDEEAANVSLRASAAINRLEGSLDLGKDAQFLSHV